MYYLDKPDPQTFIAHHGIKGQKWGVRRFQNADGSLTKAGKERYNEQNSSDSSDNHENQKFHLTEKQKKYCKTIAIATGAALVAYAGFKLADSGELNRLCEKAKELSLGADYKSFSRNDSFTGEMSVSQVKERFLNRINPEYGNSLGSFMNCRRCTFAYELSRRGYDVQATKTLIGTGQDANGMNQMLFVPRFTKKEYKEAWNAYTHDSSIYAANNFIKRLTGGFSEDIHLSKKNAIGDVYDALSKMPNSARGELSVTWKGHNGGHSLAWEVINNKPVIFYFQTHKVYETPDKFSEIANMFDGLSTATSCRLDDKDLNLDLLRRWVKHS